MTDSIVAIAVPSFDMVHTKFAFSLAMLTAYRVEGYRHALISARSSIISHARSNAVDAAIENKADWLLFLDSDMVFPPTLLKRLLEHRKDIVGCVYMHKINGTIMGRALGTLEPTNIEGLAEMDAIPTGCLLINMRVFERFKRPWFRIMASEKHGESFGEDIVFCAKARREGFSIWADTDLSGEVGHIGEKVFFPAPQTANRLAA